MDGFDHRVDVLSQFIYVDLFQGRYEYAGTVFLCYPHLLKPFEGYILRFFLFKVVFALFFVVVGINFIEYHEYGLVFCSNVHKSPVYGLYLLFKVGVGDVHYMQQYIGFPDFVECAFERFYELCGQFPDKAYGIREQERYIFYNDFPYCCVKRSEEFVLSEYVAFDSRFIKVLLPALV